MINFDNVEIGTTSVIPDSSNISLAWCPPGGFRQGADENDEYRLNNEFPQLNTYFSEGFWISATPITIGQFNIFLEEFSNPLDHDEEFPVDGISWNVAKKFCSVLTQHLHDTELLPENAIVDLPSEAQWEYACRAGTSSIWYFGNEITEIVDYAWYKNNSNNTLHPVAKKLPNQWGIYDMYGNIPEWTLDNFHLYKLLSPNKRFHNPVYQSGGLTMIVRGGSYYDPANLCRSSSRKVMYKNNPYNDEVSFRIVINSNTERTNYDNMDNSN